MTTFYQPISEAEREREEKPGACDLPGSDPRGGRNPSLSNAAFVQRFVSRLTCLQPPPVPLQLPLKSFFNWLVLVFHQFISPSSPHGANYSKQRGRAAANKVSVCQHHVLLSGFGSGQNQLSPDVISRSDTSCS